MTTKPEALPTENLAPIKPEAEAASSELAFMDTSKWTQLQRVAKAMAIAPVTPEHLRGRSRAGRFTPYSEQEVIANCIQLCEQASRWECSPFSIMKESYVVGGSLSWQGRLVAGIVNKLADLKEPLTYEYEGTFESGDYACTAIGTFKGSTVERRARVTLIDMRTDNQMYKSASKAEQKLAYDAAITWGRRHAPHILMGAQTKDDIDRIAAVEVEDAPMKIEVEATCALDAFAELPEKKKNLLITSVEDPGDEEEPYMDHIDRTEMLDRAEMLSPQLLSEITSGNGKETETEQKTGFPPISSSVRKRLYTLGASIGVNTKAVEQLALSLTGLAWEVLDEAGSEEVARCLHDMAEDSDGV